MKIVGHEAIGVHLEARLWAGLGQGFQEVLPIDIVEKDVITVVGGQVAGTLFEKGDCLLTRPDLSR